VKLFLRSLLVAGLALLAAGWLPGAERIPPAPTQYFNDNAAVVSPSVATELNAQLEQFERSSSNQLLVAIYPKMESDSSVEDYTVRVAQTWRTGQKARSNGAILFLFMQEHQAYIQVGYGLEAVLPDAVAKRIIENEIVPRFRQNDVDGGVRAAVSAMIAATNGEYRGTGRTQTDQRGLQPRSPGFFAILIVFILLSAWARRRSQRSYMFGGPRGGGWWMGPGGFGGGGSSSGGGGGYSGGGGSFGGGGAGGKW
jgi:uncharacterized protein